MRSPFIKAPSVTSYWGVDWTKELDEGESIVTSVWVIQTPSTLHVVDSYIVDGKTVVWLEDGTVGDRITVNNFITTDSQPIARQLSEQLLFWIEGAVAA